MMMAVQMPRESRTTPPPFTPSRASSSGCWSHLCRRRTRLNQRVRRGVPGETITAAAAVSGRKINESMREYRADVEKSRIVTSTARLEHRRVLVLDVAMQTSNIISWQKALVLAMFDKVDVLEYYEDMVASAYSAFYLPAVVKTRVYDKQKGAISLSRKNVLIRDNHSCTYCGAKENLTIDHIVPASKGGEWSWTNLTTACAKCNNRKGDKLLKHCNGMKLIRPAKEPCLASGEFSQFSRIVNPPDEWVPFIDPRHVKRIPEGFMDDLEFGDVSIKNNVVDVEKTLLKVKSKNNNKKKKSKSKSSSSSGAR